MAQNFDKSFFLFSHMLIRRGIPSKHLQKAAITHEKANFYYQCNHFFFHRSITLKRSEIKSAKTNART